MLMEIKFCKDCEHCEVLEKNHVKGKLNYRHACFHPKNWNIVTGEKDHEPCADMRHGYTIPVIGKIDEEKYCGINAKWFKKRGNDDKKIKKNR